MTHSRTASSRLTLTKPKLSSGSGSSRSIGLAHPAHTQPCRTL